MFLTALYPYTDLEYTIFVNIIVWVMKKMEEQHFEATQMKCLRHLLGITKLNKEKYQCIRQKTGAQNIKKEKKTVPEKVATTCTEDGHKQTTKTSTTI